MKRRIIIISIFFIGIISVIGLMLIKYKTESKEVVAENQYLPNTTWKITQFGRDDGAQMMGYAIEGNNYGLVLIDGGYYDDEIIQEEYKKIIEKHNNIIDTWIVTHYDSDHAGRYMAIREHNSEIIIKNLYVQPQPDLELCKKKAPSENDWEMYEKYLKLAEEERTIVNVGYEVSDIIGLKFKVLSVYEPWMGEELKNLLNNGSMCFKLYGNEESIIYCGDIQAKAVQTKIIANYKDDLPSDYIQIPHHGNSRFSEEFYNIVNPKLAFFDAPTWLIENRNNVSWFTVEKTKAFLEGNGIETKYFITSPNFIIMK